MTASPLGAESTFGGGGAGCIERVWYVLRVVLPKTAQTGKAAILILDSHRVLRICLEERFTPLIGAARNPEYMVAREGLELSTPAF